MARSATLALPLLLVLLPLLSLSTFARAALSPRLDHQHRQHRHHDFAHRLAPSRRHASLDRRATVFSCAETIDCTNAGSPEPDHAHRKCNKTTATCTFACDTGYILSGSTCIRSAATSTATASTRTTTTTAKPSSSTSSPSTTCAPSYTGGSSTVSGTGTLPKPTTFVKRAAGSQKLTLDGKTYRIVGPNIYWLCSDENDGPVGSPPAKSRVREVLAGAVAMGATTIRAHSCGISVGPNTPYSLEPKLGVFNSSAWDARDYAIFAAREYGLRLILPLTDNWDYYHGGKYDFIDFAGLSRNNYGEKFYSAKAVVAAFGGYITELLKHYNPYTGLHYYEDPTILAWETGNELGGYIGAEGYPPAAWTTKIVSYIRAVDSRHLVIDGSSGFWNYSTGATAPGLGVTGIDIVTDHGYPRNIGILNKEISLAKAAGKAFFIGEYDWTPTGSSVSLSDYLATIETSGSSSYMGDMIWSLFGKDAQCCNFIRHRDGYSLYYPDGGSKDDAVNALAVVQHWARLQGKAIPQTLPAVACPQPAFP
ncbi:hypothetical protein JCM9279_000714 [Rhodotorula babjevae]